MKSLIETLTKFLTDNAEIIGIIASILVLISFLMKEIRTIRTVGIISCVVFVIYGILIDALSIWLLNGILIIVHLFFLFKSRKRKKTEPRLQKFSRASFNKKGLRDLPWFFTSDLD